MSLLEEIRNNAKKNKKRIVLPEGECERTIKASHIILKEDLAELILLGNIEKIKEKEKEFDLDLSNAKIIDPKTFDKKEEYIDKFLELRKKKNYTREQAQKFMEESIYLGPMMVYMNDADGEVSGAVHTTADTVRPALQILRTAPGVSIVSGAMIMVSPKKEYGENGVMVFSDVAINPNPTAKQLAEIAISSAKTAKDIAKIEPKVALLSFSTKGSAKHELADKVIEALKIVKESGEDILIDGELQSDAAIVPKVAKSKAPNSEVAGKANVLVFPDLQAGNISYKLAQRLGDVEAIGPVLQGLAAPVNDLSRGCSVEDIVNLVAITVNQCK